MSGWRAAHNIEIKKEDLVEFKSVDLPYKQIDFVTDKPMARADVVDSLTLARQDLKQTYGNKADFKLTGGFGGKHLAVEHTKYGTAVDIVPAKNSKGVNTVSYDELKQVLERHDFTYIVHNSGQGVHAHAVYNGDYNKYKQQKAKQSQSKAKSSTGEAANKSSGTQNPYTHPDVNYDPTKRVDNQDVQFLKQVSSQVQQPPAASKPFGREPVFQSPNNAAIATTLGSVGGAGAVATGILYHEAAAGAAKVTMTVTAEIYQGSATGYAASIQGASAWSTAANAVSSAWSAATTAIGNAVAWVASAVSSAVSAIAGAIATAATVVAGAIATAASAVAGAITSAIAWIAALAFPW